MLIILSPAKTMNMSAISSSLPFSNPLFSEEVNFLAAKMKELSLDELKKQLKISDNLAEITYERYRKFNDDDNVLKQAIFAYNGTVFKSIKVKDFSINDLEYAQNHLRIISTLYGLVRPLDLIKAYRIAFDIKMDGIEGNLYDFWLPKLTNRLIEDAKLAGGIVVNLASLDVLGSLDIDLLEKNVRVVTPEFKEFRNGKYETVRTYAKLARGEMTNYILQNKIETPDKLVDFKWKGFSYNKKLSSINTLIFTSGDN